MTGELDGYRHVNRMLLAGNNHLFNLVDAELLAKEGGAGYVVADRCDMVGCRLKSQM